MSEQQLQSARSAGARRSAVTAWRFLSRRVVRSACGGRRAGHRTRGPAGGAPKMNAFGTQKEFIVE